MRPRSPLGRCLPGSEITGLWNPTIVFKYLFYSVCIYILPKCMYVYHMGAWCSVRLQWGLISPRTRVIVAVSIHECAENWTHNFWKSSQYSTTEPSFHLHFPSHTFYCSYPVLFSSLSWILIKSNLCHIFKILKQDYSNTILKFVQFEFSSNMPKII